MFYAFLMIFFEDKNCRHAGLAGIAMGTNQSLSRREDLDTFLHFRPYRPCRFSCMHGIVTG